MVIVGGWAFDYRIFASLELGYNYLLFCGDCLVDFEGELEKVLLKKDIDRISLLGWSQGAFAACAFAGGNREIVEEVILISARQKYEEHGLLEIKNYLEKNSTAYLYSFYRKFFGRQEKELYQRFKETLLKDYLKQSPQKLIEGLDWIGQAEIKPEALKDLKNITIVHGRNDSIAPVDEAIELADSLPQARLIVFEDVGHLPFLRKDFKKRLYGH